MVSHKQLQALFVRAWLMLHFLLVVWRVTVSLGGQLWPLTAAIAPFMFEAAYTVTRRDGVEWSMFSPCFLFYLTATLPGIWLLELDRTSLPDNNATVVSDTIQDAIPIPVKLSADKWILVLKQIMLYLMILGRWFLPRGQVGREQLIQRLLGFIGIASDIMELFSLFEVDSRIRYNVILNYVILCVWSLSVLQFTFTLTTSSSKADTTVSSKAETTSSSEVDIRGNNQCDIPPSVVPSIAQSDIPINAQSDVPGNTQSDVPGNTQSDVPGNTLSDITGNVQFDSAVIRSMRCQSLLKCEEAENGIDSRQAVIRKAESRHAQLRMDLLEAVVTLILQDGPFLGVRIYTMVRYNLMTYSLFFFSAKNALVIILLLYKIFLLLHKLCCRKMPSSALNKIHTHPSDGGSERIVHRKRDNGHSADMSRELRRRKDGGKSEDGSKRGSMALGDLQSVIDGPATPAKSRNMPKKREQCVTEEETARDATSEQKLESGETGDDCEQMNEAANSEVTHDILVTDMCVADQSDSQSEAHRESIDPADDTDIAPTGNSRL